VPPHTRPAPRLEIDLDRIHDDAASLVARPGCRGTAVAAVVKAALGSPEIANALLSAGVTTLADSRIENIETLRRAGVTARTLLIRSPMLSRIGRVIRHANASCYTEPDVIAAPSRAAGRAGRASAPHPAGS